MKKYIPIEIGNEKKTKTNSSFIFSYFLDTPYFKQIKYEIKVPQPPRAITKIVFSFNIEIASV